VPPGCTFRGFPIAFNHTDARKIFETLKDQPVAVHILRAHGAGAASGMPARCRPVRTLPASRARYVPLCACVRARARI
jgi:hypothetical protein